MDATSVVKILTVTGLIAIMLSMGFKVRFEEVVASLRQPQLIFLGLLANFVLVPAVTIVLLYLFNPNPMVTVGFLILAVCPGSPLAPPIASVAKGNVAFATGLMVILAGLSALLSPFLLALLLAWLLSASELQIDYVVMVKTLLVSQLLPLGLGLAIHHWAPRFASRAAKPVGLVANLLLLTVVALSLAREHESLRTVMLSGWVGMALLLVASLSIGWLCGGSDLTTQKSLAVTTAIRSAAMTLVIASNNFANTGAVTAVVAYALLSIFAKLGCAYALATVLRPSAVAYSK
jgi:bile acid:Na+ symporter, BASS family